MNEVISAQPHKKVGKALARKKENSLVASIFVRNCKKQAIKLSLPRHVNLQQFKENIAKRMNVNVSDQALFLHGRQIAEDKQQIQLLDGLIFHIVNLNRIKLARISIQIRRIQPNSPSFHFIVDPKMEISQFMATMLSLQFPDVYNYFLVSTGRELQNSKCFEEEFVEDGSELLAIHKIENRKAQNMELKTESSGKSLAEKHRKNLNKKLDEIDLSRTQKKEKQKQLIEVSKEFPTQQIKSNSLQQSDILSQQIPQKEVPKNENKGKIIQINQSRDEEEEATFASHELYQTAKFKSAEEINGLKKKEENAKENRRGEESPQKQVQIEETEQIVIGNYNALSFNEKGPVSATNEERTKISNKQVSTRYGLVPKKQSIQFNRDAFEAAPLSQSNLPEIMVMQKSDGAAGAIENENLYGIAIQYLDKQKEMIENIEVSDKPELKSSFSPSQVQMTLRTISSHYDDEMNSSIKSRADDQNIEYENQYSQSLVYDNTNSVRYQIGKVQNRNPQIQSSGSLHKSNSGPEQNSKGSFLKKPKTHIRTLGELPSVTQEGKTKQIESVILDQPTQNQKELAQTVDPVFFHPYQEQAPKTQQLTETDGIHQLQHKTLDQSQVKIHLQDSGVFCTNRGSNDNHTNSEMRRTFSIECAQQPPKYTEISESQQGKKQEQTSFNRNNLAERNDYSSSAYNENRMSISGQSKKYPHISNISETTSIYQANTSDFPLGDPQEIINRFPHLDQIRNSFTSDIEDSTNKWESVQNGISVAAAQSDLFSGSSQNYQQSGTDPDHSRANQQKAEQQLEKGVLQPSSDQRFSDRQESSLKQQNGGNSFFQKEEKNDENNLQKEFSEHERTQKQEGQLSIGPIAKNNGIEQMGQKNSPKNEQINKATSLQDSQLLQESQNLNKMLSSQNLLDQSGETSRELAKQLASPAKNQQEDDNLLNYVLNSSEKFNRRKQIPFLGDRLTQGPTTQIKSVLTSSQNQRSSRKFSFCLQRAHQQIQFSNLRAGDMIMVGSTAALHLIENNINQVMLEEKENIVEALRSEILSQFYELQQKQQVQRIRDSQKKQEDRKQAQFQKKEEEQNLLLDYL